MQGLDIHFSRKKNKPSGNLVIFDSLPMTGQNVYSCFVFLPEVLLFKFIICVLGQKCFMIVKKSSS